jgi:hypothetical protein
LRSRSHNEPFHFDEGGAVTRCSFGSNGTGSDFDVQPETASKKSHEMKQFKTFVKSEIESPPLSN